MAESNAQSQGVGSQEGGGDTKKKVSIVKILILLLLAIVVFGGVAAGVLYFLYGTESSGTGGASKTEAGKPQASEALPTPAVPTVVSTYELKPFIVNLADSGSYLKTTIALGYGVAEQEQLLKSKTPQMRDAILTILSSKSAKALSTKHGKMKLKDDIHKALNQLPGLTNVVVSVYFTEFQIL